MPTVRYVLKMSWLACVLTRLIFHATNYLFSQEAARLVCAAGILGLSRLRAHIEVAQVSTSMLIRQLVRGISLLHSRARSCLIRILARLCCFQRSLRALEHSLAATRHSVNRMRHTDLLQWLSVCDGHCTEASWAQRLCSTLSDPRACKLAGACAVYENHQTHILASTHHLECVGARRRPPSAQACRSLQALAPARM